MSVIARPVVSRSLKDAASLDRPTTVHLLPIGHLEEPSSQAEGSDEATEVASRAGEYVLWERAVGGAQAGGFRCSIQTRRRIL